MMKALRLFVAVMFLGVDSFGQTPGPFTPKDIIPFLSKLHVNAPDTGQVQLLIALSDRYFYRNERPLKDLDSALFYSTLAQQMSSMLAFDKGLAMTHFQLAAILPLKDRRAQGKASAVKATEMFLNQKEYRMLGESYYRLAGYYSLSETEIKYRIALLYKSQNAFHIGGYFTKEGEVLETIGEVYLLDDSYGPALSSLKQALQKFHQGGSNNIGGIYDLMGSVYTDMGAPNEGIKYGLMAIHHAHEFNDPTLRVCTFYNHVGIAYHSIREYNKGYEYFKRAMVIAIKHNDLESIHIVAGNLASALLELKKYQKAIRFLDQIVAKYPLPDVLSKLWIDRIYISIFRAQKQYDKAEKYVKEFELLASESMTESRHRDMIYNAIIPYFFDNFDYTKAAKYVHLFKKTGDKSNARVTLIKSHLWQAKLDSISGNYLSALANLQIGSGLRDSIFNQDKSRQISQIEIIYEVEKKDESIHSLTKQALLQNTMLKQASVIQKITYACLILLIIVIFLLVAGYRLIQKNNRNIANRQEEIDSKNISLGRLLTEKEWLIKEIHHRVKNNLHMIVGLLESQSEFLKGNEAKIAVAESQHRIQAMSMIHQKLYQTENLSSVDISAYVHELVQYLTDSSFLHKKISFELKIQRVDMNVSHSVPLGLILNEALVNSLKYAFPDGREGKITVTFEQTSDEHFVLTSSDNGIGLHPDFNIKQPDSFGFSFIQGLCDEVGGQLEIISYGGTTVRFGFDYIQK